MGKSNSKYSNVQTNNDIPKNNINSKCEIIQTNNDTPKNNVQNEKFVSKTPIIVAIEIGTTWSGYAFAFRYDPEKIFLNKNWISQYEKISFKTPTCVLIGPDEEFVAFGYDAQEREAEQYLEGTYNYELYNNFMMENYLTTDQWLYSKTGHRVRAVKIFGYLLKGLKDHCLDLISCSWCLTPEKDMVHWVLTVPAFWYHTSEDFLRQVACEAGLIRTKNSDLLSLVLSPDAAGLYCKTRPVTMWIRNIQKEITLPVSERNFKYLVIQAEQETFETTGYQVTSDGEICRMFYNSIPLGIIQVDQKFKELLYKLLGEDCMKEWEISYPNEFFSLKGGFDFKKRLLSDTRSIMIKITYSLWMYYKRFYGRSIDEDLKTEKIKGVKILNGCIKIENVEFLFSETLDKLNNHVQKMLQSEKLVDVKYIMLVGEFGSYPILQKRIMEIIPKGCSLIIPYENEATVLKGAVAFGIQPEEIKNQVTEETQDYKQIVEQKSEISVKNVTNSISSLLVIAIDLGTTYSGYAFAVANKADQIFMNPNWRSSVSESHKTPTCVLIGPNEEFVTFGYDALHSKLLQDHPADYHLYNNFKMHLHRKKNMVMDRRLSSTSGHIVKALKIFSYMIKGLKDHCLDHIEKAKASLPHLDEIHWVLTVPAIWSDNAKDFMRQAAYDAGLTDAKDSEALTIAFEPEAAGMICNQYPVTMCSKNGTSENTMMALKKEDKLLVVDAGGGTVDIVGYQISKDGEIYELISPNGGPWGSIEVDNKFIQFLSVLLGEDFLTHFQKSFPYEYQQLGYDIEHQKKTLTGASNLMRIDMKYVIVHEYEKFHGTKMEDGIKQKNIDGVYFRNGAIFIENVRPFFEETLGNICDHMKTLLRKSSLDGIKYVLLVGGFGQCGILQEAIKNIMPPSSYLIIPLEAQLAVVKGAVLYGINPMEIKGRIIHRTYGIGIMKENFGRKRGILVFEPLKFKGDSVQYDDVISKIIPVQDDENEMRIDIYCTDETDFDMGDFIDNPSIKRNGFLKVILPDLKRNCEAIIVDFQFGGTEIKVKARDMFGKMLQTKLAL